MRKQLQVIQSKYLKKLSRKQGEQLGVLFRGVGSKTIASQNRKGVRGWSLLGTS